MNPTSPLAPRPWSVAADTLVDLLQLRAAENGAQPAYTFLRDGETEEATWTYADLAQRARAIAVQLREQGVAPGDRAILLYPSRATIRPDHAPGRFAFSSQAIPFYARSLVRRQPQPRS